jgi:TonB family protein
MLRRSVLAALALALAAPALAMPSAAPLGPVAVGPQTAPAGSPPPPFPFASLPVAASSSHTFYYPRWERLPTGDEFARLYPPEARRRGLDGQTKMRCKILKDGALTDCTILQENPPALGFGEAALAAARYFKMTATVGDGKSIEGDSVIIPHKWQITAPPPSPPDSPASTDPIANLFPAAAKAKNVGGFAKMNCLAQTDGSLSGCVIVSECPAGLGFGEATLKFVPYVKMRPKTVQGRPVASRVIVPIAWKLVGAKIPATCPQPPTSSKP